jgi:xylulokinase
MTGAADTASSLLGAGVIDPGNLLVNISTGGQLILPVRKFTVDQSGRTHTFCSALEPNPRQAGWYKMAATLSAGQSLRWLRDNVFGLSGTDAYEQMTALAEQVRPGAGGLIFLPYLSGERTPLMDPKARGVMFGLTLKHGRGELVRAVMEGVTLSLYDAYLALIESAHQPKRIILSGGGARSPLWWQIVADVFGLPVQRLQINEAAAMGAALLGGAGLGFLDAEQTSRSWAKYDPSLEPNSSNMDRYQAMLETFRGLYLKTRVDFTRAQDLSD